MASGTRVSFLGGLGEIGRNMAVLEIDGKRVDKLLVQRIPLKAGGNEQGAHPPSAGSLHRAGCEDGWVGSVTGPAGFTFFLSSPVPLRGRLRVS